MNKKILIPVILIATIFVFLVTACDKKVAKLANAGAPPPPPGFCDTITYNKHIKTIIDLKCGSGANNGAGCHSSPNVSGGILLTNYAQVKAKADDGRINARVFVDNNMPAFPETPLTQAQKDLLKCWLENGTKE